MDKKILEDELKAYETNLKLIVKLRENLLNDNKLDFSKLKITTKQYYDFQALVVKNVSFIQNEIIKIKKEINDK